MQIVQYPYQNYKLLQLTATKRGKSVPGSYDWTVYHLKIFLSEKHFHDRAYFVAESCMMVADSSL